MSKLKIWLGTILFAISSIPNISLANISDGQINLDKTDFFEIGYVFAGNEPIALVLSEKKDAEFKQLIVLPEQKVQHDFLGRPVDYQNYPQDKTVYLKADPNVKPQALPKEAIESFDKASEKWNQKPELKTLLPQEAVDYMSKQETAKGMNMLLSGTPPNPSTNLNSNDLWLSQNLITNPGFEDGFNNWSWQNKQGDTHQEDCTVSYSGSCSEKVSVASAGNFWETQVFQVLRLDQNTDYKLRFKLKASTSASFSLEAVQNHTPFNNLGLWKYQLTASTDWQEYEFYFSGLATDQDARLTFYLGESAADYWFDDIELIPDNFNRLKNPSFENGTTSWDFYIYSQGQGTLSTDTGAMPDGNTAAKIDFTGAGENWEVNLAQGIGAVSSAKTYAVTFYARSFYQNRLAYVALAQNYSPWSDLTDEVEFTATPDWQKYEIDFTPSSSDSNARVIFLLGTDTISIEFDDIHVFEKQVTRFDTEPTFSAIYDDPDSGDYAEYYQVQIIKYDGAWSNPVWDSGKTSFTSSVLEGDRTEDIAYDGDALPLDGMKYNWRIKLWDESNNEGAWTNGEDFFIMNGKRIQDLSYSYDNVGNIAQIIDQSETNTRKTAEYEYDELYRLTSATITDSATEEDYTQTYTYDSLGNTTYRSDVGDYDYEGNTGSNYANPHAVTSVQNDAVVINYDQNGNLTDEVLSQYQWTIFEAGWDYNNRMITSGGWSAETLYLYDHSGQRILKDTGDEYSGITSIYANQYYNERTNKETSELTKTLNVYDNKGNLVATAEEAGETNNLYYVNGDHLGSSSVMTTDEGEQEQVVDYFPFGNMRFNERSDAENWSFDEKKKFTGHEYDADAAGLTYMGARYYSGEAGKFISQDPLFWIVGDKDYNDMWREKLFSPQSLNSYSYGLNNPMIYLDPTGLDSDVFYTKPFSSQASAEQSRLSSAYGEPVYMHEVSTVNQFTSAWNGMGKNGSDIDEVTILSHSDANNIYLNGDKEKLTTTPNMFNVDPKTLGTSIDSLSKKDIGQINLYTCEGGNISHATNLAKAFATSQQTTVMGFDGRLSFVPFLGSPMFSLRGQLKHYNEYGRAPLGWVTYSKNGSYSVGNDSQRPPYIYKWIGYFAGFNN